MKSYQSQVGQVLVDSLPFSQSGTLRQAQGLKEAGADAMAGYLGVISKYRVGYLLEAGIGYLPVTLAGEYNDGAKDEVDQLRDLCYPLGCHVMLDMEGLAAFRTDPKVLIGKIDAWATEIRFAGYKPGLYAGVPGPLTSDELYALKVELYWKGQGSLRDRNNSLAEPTKCGWAITQMYPSHMRGGVWVDSNMVGQDFRGRTPIWAVK